jgi:hypothetical protein
MINNRDIKIASLLAAKKRILPKDLLDDSYLYHGIDFNILSSEQNFLNEIKSYLPKSWKKINGNGQKLIFIAPPCENISLWEDAISADCEQWISPEGQMALQRDFVALTDSDNTIWIMTPLKIDDGFFNSMRWIISQRLINLNKVVLHSSAVSIDPKSKEAYIFIGKSGAGKTTIASLAEDRLVLGDDMNILEVKDDTLFIEAAMLGQRIQNSLTHDHKFKVKSIYWPIQDTSNYTRQMPSKEIALKIISSMVNIYWPSQSKQVVLKSLQLMNSIKEIGNFSYLHFTRSKEFWHVLN